MRYRYAQSKNKEILALSVIIELLFKRVQYNIPIFQKLNIEFNLNLIKIKFKKTFNGDNFSIMIV